MASDELRLGFDPLNPDSDSSLTSQNEAGNGILDGMEKFGDQLPSYVKSRIGADPFVNDTDSDGLTDDFELMELGLLTDVRSGDSDGNGVPDAQEDPDKDGLTNLQEQTYGTDPLSPDSDHDGLTDPQEIAAGTNPRLADTDNDGLSDSSEIRLGTNPNNPDSDGDGVPDGQETYTSLTNNSTLGVKVAVTAKGDAAQNVSITNETSPYYSGVQAISGPIVDITLNESFSSANITIPYDPSKHSDYQNLGLFTYNKTLGTFVQIPATVDPVSHTLTATTNHFSIYSVFYIPIWNSLFSTPMRFGTTPPQGGPWDVTFSGSDFQTSSMRWFNYGNEFPVGPYKITAYGKYNMYAYMALPYINLWETGAKKAWETFGLEGIWVRSDPGYGWTEGYDEHLNQPISFIRPISVLGDQTATLSYNHTGGRLGMHVYDESGFSNNWGYASYTIEYTGDTNVDHDGDGLSDILETTGFRDGLGNWYHTDPNNADTDGDGLDDGVEAGQLMTNAAGQKYYNIISDPTKVDGDGDGINDPDEEEFSCDPLDNDTDNDWLNDGFELQIGTEPTLADTDGDGPNDFEEYYDPLSDPLVYEKHYSAEEVARELMSGFVWGDIKSDEHGNVYYIAGQIISGLLIFGDVRDFGNALHEDNLAQAALNVIGLIPEYGDAEKIGDDVGKFIIKHPDEAADIATSFAKVLPESPTKTSVIEKVIDNSDELTEAKNSFNDAEAAYKCVEAGIDIVNMKRALEATQAFNRYPGLKDFLEEQVAHGTLKDRMTHNAQKLASSMESGNPSYRDWFSRTLCGTYTEFCAKIDTGGDVIKDVDHVNSRGYDYVATKGGNELIMVEAKAVRNNLALSDLKRFITKDKKFNINYAVNKLGDSYFMDSPFSKKLVFYINSPESSSIRSNLISQLDGFSQIPYTYRKAGQVFTGTVEIVISAVNK